MARDPFVKIERDCPRGCGETIEGYQESIDLSVEQHLANDHDYPWNEVAGWPRRPELRGGV